jgi:hypothetical protein
MGNKEELIYSIKAWLQRFGNRDNETFSYELTNWRLSLQYDYDLDGSRIEPYNWCLSGFKHVHNNSLNDRSDEELRGILNELITIKEFY